MKKRSWPSPHFESHFMKTPIWNSPHYKILTNIEDMVVKGNFRLLKLHWLKSVESFICTLAGSICWYHYLFCTDNSSNIKLIWKKIKTWPLQLTVALCWKKKLQHHLKKKTCIEISHYILIIVQMYYSTNNKKLGHDLHKISENVKTKNFLQSV